MRPYLTFALLASFAAAALVGSASVHAQAYQYTDASGRVHYAKSYQDALGVRPQASATSSYESSYDLQRRDAQQRAQADAQWRYQTHAAQQRDAYNAQLEQERARAAAYNEARARAQQAAQERCNRRGECGNDVVNTGAAVVIARSPQSIQQAAPFPVRR